MREKTIVRLKITSTTLTASDIEARLGLAPDESWKIGDKIGNFGAVLKEHGYALESTSIQGTQPAEYVRAMIKRVAHIAQKIGELSASATVEMSCMLHRKAVPTMAFDRDTVRWLAAMGARLDIDLLIIADRPQEPAKKPDPASGSNPSGSGL